MPGIMVKIKFYEYKSDLTSWASTVFSGLRACMPTGRRPGDTSLQPPTSCRRRKQIWSLYRLQGLPLPHYTRSRCVRKVFAALQIPVGQIFLGFQLNTQF